MRSRRGWWILALALALLASGVVGGVLVVQGRRRARVWQIPLDEALSHSGRVSPRFADSGRLLVFSCGSVSDVWSLEGEEPRHVGLWRWQRWAAPEALVAAGADLAVVSDEHATELHSLRDGRVLATIPGLALYPPGQLHERSSVALSASGTRLAIARDDGTVELRALPSGELLRTLSSAFPPLVSTPATVPSWPQLAFSTAGDRLWLQVDLRFGVWSTSTGERTVQGDGRPIGFLPSGEVAVVEKHEDSKRLVAVSPAGSRPLLPEGRLTPVVLAPSGDEVLLFDTALAALVSLESSGTLVELPRSASMVRTGDVSLDGDRVAVVSHREVLVATLPR